MVDLKAALNNLLYQPKKTPTSGQAERTWFTDAKRITGSSAAAAAAPVVAASGITGAVTRLVAPSVGNVIKRGASYSAVHPVTSLKIATTGLVAGIVGFNAIKTNPKIVTTGAPMVHDFLKDAGTTIGKVSGSGSFSDAYGHLKGFVNEHPIGSGVAAIVGAGAGGLAASRLISDYQTRESIKGLGTLQGGGQSGINMENSAAEVPEGQGYLIVPDETSTKKAVKRTYRRPSKAKNINRSPITIKNYNIMGVGRHG